MVEEVSQPGTSAAVKNIATTKGVPRRVRLTRWTMRFTRTPQLHRREGRDSERHSIGELASPMHKCTIRTVHTRAVGNRSSRRIGKGEGRLVARAGIEPATPAFSVRCSTN